jgi:adenine-specific DNA methylase
VWIYNAEEKPVIKSYNHEGNIYMHSPEMVAKILENGGLKLIKQFNFSFTTNPKKEVHTHKAVGQIYGK